MGAFRFKRFTISNDRAALKLGTDAVLLGAAMSLSGKANPRVLDIGTGTGVIAGGAVRSVMEAAGISNIRAKCLRSKNPQNVVKATFNGLMALRGPEEVARIRGKNVDEILG